MTGESIATVSISVVSLCQLIKWAGLPDHWGPLVVMFLSALGVAFWGWTQNDLSRLTAFAYFAGWIVVTTSAAGVYGFSRASAAAVIRALPPPNDGAGSEPTLPTKGDMK
jgi:hypothetical protein